MSFQSRASIEELVGPLDAQRKKLEDEHETTQRMLKESFFFLNSELGMLQAKISKELISLQKQLADQKIAVDNSLYLEIKQVTARVLLCLRAQYEKLLVSQREQATDTTDIHSQNAEVMEYLAEKNIQSSKNLEAQCIQSQELRNKLAEIEAKLSQYSDSNEVCVKENANLSRQVERYGEEVQSTKELLENCKKDSARLRDEDEQQRKALIAKHSNELKLVEESTRKKEKETLGKIHLSEIQRIRENRDKELSTLQQKLENTKSEALAQQAENEGTVKQWELRLQQSHDLSITNEARLKKVHREEVGKVQAELEDLSCEVSSLQSDVRYWKATYEKLFAEHNIMIDVHARQLYEQSEKQDRELSKHKEEMKITVSKFKTEAEQHRSTSTKISSDLQLQLTQVKEEAEQFKKLWTQVSSQIVSCKQSSSQTLAALNEKYAAVISSREQALEIKTKEVQSLTSQLSASAITHAAELNVKDLIIKKLQGESRSQREELLNTGLQKQFVSSERDGIQKDLKNALNQITQLHDDINDIQKHSDLAKVETDQLKNNLALRINSLEADIQSKNDTIKSLEANHRLVVTRLQDNFNAKTSRDETLRYQLAAEKKALEKELENIKLGLERLESQYTATIAKRDVHVEVAQKELKELMSRGEAREKKSEAQLRNCQDEIAKLHKDRDVLVEQSRNMEPNMAQTCSSDYGSLHAHVVLPQEQKHLSENTDEQVLEKILLDCDDLKKSINEAARVLRAEEDESRRLSAKYTDLQKEFGQSFSWKTGKHKGLSRP